MDEKQEPRGTTTRMALFWAAFLTGAVVVSVMTIRAKVPQIAAPDNVVQLYGGGGLSVGFSAPAIKAAGWLNGPPPSEAEMRGKVIVVDAWAHWCRPCFNEAPKLVNTYRKFKDRGVVFVGLTSDPESEKAQCQSFLDAAGITWPNGYGADTTLTALYADRIPLVWVIGRDGNVAWNFISTESLDTAIETALAAGK